MHHKSLNQTVFIQNTRQSVREHHSGLHPEIIGMQDMQDTQVMQGVQGMKSEMTGMHAPIPAGIIGMREFTREFLAAYLRTSWVCMRERQRECV